VGRVVQGQKPQWGSPARVDLQLLPSRPQSLSCKQCVTMETLLSECTISEQRGHEISLGRRDQAFWDSHKNISSVCDKCIGQRKFYEWVKSKAVPLHAMKALGGRGIQLLLILDLGTRWGWVVSVTPRPRFTPGERTPGTHCTGGWVGPRAGMDTEARGKILCPCRGSNPDRPVVQPVVRHYTAWANPAPKISN
jgi:hypothetical protein